MNTLGEPWLTRHTTCYAAPEATATELLNDATEWLQYARNTVTLLGELIEDTGEVDERRLALVLQGIGALIELGMRCAMQAHAQLQLQQTSTIEELHND